MKQFIKKSLSHFPVLYEIVLYFVSWCRVIRINKRKVYKMSEQEIKEFDGRLYLSEIGKKLDWNNLNTYTEKMQWAKIYDKNSLKVRCADKYAVREWVIETLGNDKILVPLIGVFERFEDINFNDLPQSFAIKTTGGCHDVMVVKDKSKLTWADYIEMRRRIKLSLLLDLSNISCEMHYHEITPRIVVEEVIGQESDEDLEDYKFLCFDGKPYYCWVDKDRFGKHSRMLYDLNWNLQEWKYNPEVDNYQGDIKKPDNFDEMIMVVSKLAKGFSHVRVDLYNVNGKIYFGEMTFTSSSGLCKIQPESADYHLGSLWNINCNG